MRFRMGDRSALANEGRRIGRGFRLEHPAHTELEVHRIEGRQRVVGGRTRGALAPGQRTVDDGGLDRAQVQVASRELELEIVRYGVGDTRLRRPSQVPVRGILRREAEAGGTVGDEPDVADGRDRVPGAADADADEWGEASPRSEIQIGVEKEHLGGV